MNTNGERRRQKRERRFILGAVAAGVLAAVPASTQDRGSACQELVLYNGKIATMDARNSMALSVTIRADRIAAVGTARGIPAHDACATLVDLRGRTVIPGLIDSHNHIVQLSLKRGHDMRDVESAFSIPELQQVTRSKASTLPAGEWITAVGGWAPNQFVERRLPTLAELDAAAPTHPIYLQTGFAGPAATNSTGKAFFGQHGVAVGNDGSIGARVPTVAAWNALKSPQTDADRKRGAVDVMMYAASVGLTTSDDKGGAWPADTPGTEGIAQLGKNSAGDVIEPLDQRLTRMQALRMYTANQGWFTKEEHMLGSIEVGKLADLVVLSDDFLDPQRVPDAAIPRIRSVLTVVGGKMVYDAGVVGPTARRP